MATQTEEYRLTMSPGFDEKASDAPTVTGNATPAEIIDITDDDSSFCDADFDCRVVLEKLSEKNINDLQSACVADEGAGEVATKYSCRVIAPTRLCFTLPKPVTGDNVSR